MALTQQTDGILTPSRLPFYDDRNNCRLQHHWLRAFDGCPYGTCRFGERECPPTWISEPDSCVHWLRVIGWYPYGLLIHVAVVKRWIPLAQDQGWGPYGCILSVRSTLYAVTKRRLQLFNNCVHWLGEVGWVLLRTDWIDGISTTCCLQNAGTVRIILPLGDRQPAGDKNLRLKVFLAFKRNHVSH